MAATQHAQSIKQDSQTYLATALLQLLVTTDLTDITVTQVVKRAGVSRMAFYRNFATLDDILVAHFRPLIDAQFDAVMYKQPAEKMAALSDFLVTNIDVLQLAVDRGFEHVIQEIFNDNMLRFYKQIDVWSQLTPAQQTYWPQFMSAGVYRMWREWLLGGQQESLTTIHDLIGGFQRATLAGLLEQRTGDQ
ncbi:TetR/AcrR family transcriptional regulator [Furfurilactobacillus entadae]|uniref:TetR/AcrR family transcriptional regulator n=1 Tax=Furfurilactobacillus entadae TaxID=2922307 RepID=UPI0035F0160A